MSDSALMRPSADESFGVRSMTAPLRRALTRSPATTGDFLGAGWRQPDVGLLARQHEAFCELLTNLGVEVIVAPAIPGLVDACYTFDPAFVTSTGAIVLRAAKPIRVEEPLLLKKELEAAGVPVVGRLEEPAHADGGDLLWLDESTLLAGRGYRTNTEAHRQLTERLAHENVKLERCDLAHDRGPGHVLHLLSVVSPVADDLALVFEPLAPVPLLEQLDARGVRRISVDTDEFGTLACNALAIRPGVVVMVDGNPRTRRALEATGCEVHVYDGSELSLKGDGGPTCLTRPLLRRE